MSSFTASGITGFGTFRAGPFSEAGTYAPSSVGDPLVGPPRVALADEESASEAGAAAVVVLAGPGVTDAEGSLGDASGSGESVPQAASVSSSAAPRVLVRVSRWRRRVRRGLGRVVMVPS